ncbi:MAG: CBS domain-containing protein [Betaproteobacteria bacterium]|nr:CBS domain-containing protein [Betaproteobacteria bacterium]
MTLDGLYCKSVATVRRDATVADAARAMRDAQVRDLVVVDPGDARRPVGIITDRDIAIKIVGQGLNPAWVPVEHMMSAPAFSLRDRDGVYEALKKMAARGVRRAPVVDPEGRLTGLVAVDDLLALLAQELARISVLLRRGRIAEVRGTDDAVEEELSA